jgi:hypothetical protein
MRSKAKLQYLFFPHELKRIGKPERIMCRTKQNEQGSGTAESSEGSVTAAMFTRTTENL